MEKSSLTPAIPTESTNSDASVSDSKFPYLPEKQDFAFPAPETATPDGIVAVGGNLSPGMLLSAYRRGIFPWYSGNQPILWWSPDPRFLLSTVDLHLSRRFKRLIKQRPFSFSTDQAFDSVIRSCATVSRPNQPGTWITEEMISAYIELHKLGYAHSLEVWTGDELAGGLYGVLIGSMFSGESMFALTADASKAALAVLATELAEVGIDMIDCQVHTEHLERFGAREVPRASFLQTLRDCIACSDNITEPIWRRKSGLGEALYRRLADR